MRHTRKFIQVNRHKYTNTGPYFLVIDFKFLRTRKSRLGKIWRMRWSLINDFLSYKYFLFFPIDLFCVQLQILWGTLFFLFFMIVLVYTHWLLSTIINLSFFLAYVLKDYLCKGPVNTTKTHTKDLEFSTAHHCALGWRPMRLLIQTVYSGLGSMNPKCKDLHEFGGQNVT